jgi:hypothetical protein
MMVIRIVYWKMGEGTSNKEEQRRNDKKGRPGDKKGA